MNEQTRADRGIADVKFYRKKGWKDHDLINLARVYAETDEIANKILLSAGAAQIPSKVCPSCGAEISQKIIDDIKCVFHGASAPGGPYGTVVLMFKCGGTYSATGFWSEIRPSNEEVLLKKGNYKSCGAS